MKTKPKPIARFRLHPNRGRCYFSVFVWKNKHQLRAHTGIKCVGLCRGHEILDFHRSGKTQRRSDIGEIHFCKEALGVGIVAHEMTHAAFRWADHTGNELVPTTLFPECSKSEEKLCFVVGNLVRLFVIKAYALGIYRE